MAIIYSYPLKTTPLGKDLLILTDSAVKSKNATKSLTIDGLASYIVGNYPGSPINGSGTFNTIPLWTPDGKTLGDSNINQDANGDIAVGVNLIVVDDLSVQGEIDVDNIITVNGSGDSVFNSTVTFNNDISVNGDAVFKGEANFKSSVTDQASSPGTAGQVLSSTGANVEWINAAQGTVLGSGTSPFLPYWLDGETLGDSPISWFPTNTPQPKLFIDTNVSITGEVSFLEDIIVDAALLAPDNITPGSHTPGTPGQVLTSTGTQVEWVDQSAAITKLVPYFQLATPGGSATYTQSNNIVDFDWSGGSGTYEYILPSATAIPYRKIRFVNNSTITASDKIHITAPGTETIDGGAFYEINKPYNGCAVWSDGVQWIVIQAKG